MEGRLATIVFLIALGLQSLSAQIRTHGTYSDNNSSNKVEKFPSDEVLTTLLEKLVNDGRAMGIVVGLLESNGKQRVVSYGSPGANRLPLDGDSVFEIGSISKVFTGILLADMVIKGEVKLDDPVEKYLPSGVHMPKWGQREITLLDLSTHYSGLPRLPTNFRPKDPSNPYADYTVENLYEFLTGYKLTRSPGAEWEYSNLGVAVLGHVLAIKANMPYAELVTQRILRPLGMKHTAIALTSDMRKHLVQGHNAFGDPVQNWDLGVFAGTGALRSTANDMLRFAAANLSKKGGSPYDAMRLAHLPRMRLDAANRIGLNWMVSDPNQLTITYHNGGTGGFRGAVDLDEAAHRAVIILTNSAIDLDIGFPMLDATRKLAPTAVRVAVAKEYRRCGLNCAMAAYRALKEKGGNDWIFNEDQLNDVGYWLLRQQRNEDAVVVFQSNVEIYPNISNLYDSLGEGYLAVGDKENATKNYRRAVEINPKNSSSIEALKKLGAYP